MAEVEFINISKAFGEAKILNQVSLNIKDGEFMTLLGPSGCGKSTLLRIIAGLMPFDGGQIRLDGRDVSRLRPSQRDISMVFQTYALYPHMTAAQNIAVPLRMRRLNFMQRLPILGHWLPGSRNIERSIEEDVASAAGSLGIGHLLERKPAQLSGGQRQRVAVGRAMVRRPSVFLMDEPLSNLDAALRTQLRAEIKDLHQKLGVTFIYVTHDQTEAMTMSDRVAVMKGGNILQIAEPGEIYRDPHNLDVAEFIGSPKINVLRGMTNGVGMINVAGGKVKKFHGLLGVHSVHIGIRPESLKISNVKDEASIPGRIKLSENLGPEIILHVEVEDSDRLVQVRQPFGSGVGSISDGAVFLRANPEDVLVFSEEGLRIYPEDADARTGSAKHVGAAI